jgi:hypothetical protein
VEPVKRRSVSVRFGSIVMKRCRFFLRKLQNDAVFNVSLWLGRLCSGSVRFG